MSGPAQTAALMDAVKAIYDLRFAELASSSIIVWDHIATFDQEIELVWKARWSLGKIIFFVNRYYTLAAVIVNNVILFSDWVDDLVSRQWFIWQGATGLISVALSQITLMLRLYALYQLNKLVLTIMIIVFLGSVGAAAAILFHNLFKVQTNAHFIPGMPFCVPTGLSDHFWTYWIPVLTCESLLCALALFRAFSGTMAESPPNVHEKLQQRAGWCTQNAFARRLTSIFRNGQRIVDVLIRDSIIFFLVMFGAYLANALIWMYGSAHIFEIPIGFSEAMACVLSSRLLLNVRGVHAQLQHVDTEAAHAMHGPPGSPGALLSSTRHGPQVHIHAVVETVAVRDGDDDDHMDKAPPLGMNESPSSVYAARRPERGGNAAVRSSGAWRPLRRQLTDVEAFQLRTMKSY